MFPWLWWQTCDLLYDSLCGLTDFQHVDLEERVAIFLYMCVTGLSIRHVGESFQHCNETT